MSSDLRRAWTEIITGHDYDQHMAAVGQAQANAELVRDLMESLCVRPGARILFAGAGTGQMFDFVSTEFLEPFVVTFADINPAFLAQLEARLANKGLQFNVQQDDVEATLLQGPFDLVALVLVLEHVDWRTALEQMAGLDPQHVVLITQENPPSITTGVTPGRKLPLSLEEATKIAHSSTIEAQELKDELAKYGFTLVDQDDRQVPDDKIMRGMIFEKA